VLLLISLLIHSAMAGALVGVDYVPSGLGEQAWVAEGQLTGTQVAERDGLLVPPLRSFGGFTWKRNAALMGLSMARISTSVQTTADGSRSTRTALRPSVDYRRWLMDRKPEKPLAYVTAGMHGVIPFASETADSATDADQQALKEAADQDRERIGAVGAQVGIGAEVMWNNGVSLGLRTSLVAHRSQATDSQTRTVSSVVRPETALSLSFDF
jgi:hypothetical protein